MKIYFANPEYDEQISAHARFNRVGAQIGETWAIAAQIREGDVAGWYNAWSLCRLLV